MVFAPVEAASLCDIDLFFRKKFVIHGVMERNYSIPNPEVWQRRLVPKEKAVWQRKAPKMFRIYFRRLKNPLAVGWRSSPAANTLTRDKYLIKPHIRRPQLSLQNRAFTGCPQFVLHIKACKQTKNTNMNPIWDLLKRSSAAEDLFPRWS